jgi:phenolic acid decarboxylase
MTANTRQADHIQVIGRSFIFDFGPNAIYQLYFVNPQHLEVRVIADAGFPKGTLNRFEIQMTALRPNLYMVTWVEPETGNTVVHVQDYERGVAYTSITDLASQQFWRQQGEIRPQA